MSQLLNFFHLNHHPFARLTTEKALHRHQGFEEAFKRLLFTIELDAIAALIAESGCGKSLLLGTLADQLQTQGWQIHYFAHSTASAFGLLNVVARLVGVAPKRARAETANAIATALVGQGQHLLIIDEAHQLADATLEDVRLLTIADFDRRSPFVLLLSGQPEFDDRLAEPVHHALDQRITTIARLGPLSPQETRQYLMGRLAAAGGGDRPFFEDGAIDAIFEGAAGVPRRINSLATASLIVAATRDSRIVSAQDVHDARIDRGRS